MTKKLIASLTIAATVLALALFAADTARERKLQQAIDLMESKGDLAKAIPMLEDVAHSSDRALAARGLLILGDAQQRRGGSQARATYERIVKEFGSETETASAARQRLASLGGAPAGLSVGRRRLCSDCAADDGDVSSDGRWQVFTDLKSGDLAIRDMSKGQVKRLLVKTGAFEDDPSEALGPVFSPDLTQIAYLWDGFGKDDHHQLRVMPNKPGAKSRVLTDSYEDICWADGWSPDGKSLLAYIIKKKENTKQLVRISVSEGAVKVLKPLGWRTGYSKPTYSPDGQWIVYEARAVNPTADPPAPTDPADTHIYVLSADGSRETEIVKAAGENRQPVWTPDGAHILFISNRTGHWDLWSVAVKDGKAAGPETLVHAEIGRIWAMGFRGGSYIYYYSGPDDLSKTADFVNIVDLGASRNSPGSVAHAESFVGVWPRWSPDGKSIAFKRHRPSADGFDLVVRSVDTGDERAYASKLGVSGNSPVTWSHDGKTVVDLIAGAPYRVDLKTGEFVTMPNLPKNTQFNFSPDDNTVYFNEDFTQRDQEKPARIFATDLGTGQSRDVFTMPEPGWDPFYVSPDGRTLVGSRYEPYETMAHLFRVEVDGTGYRELYNIAMRDFYFNFTLTKDGRWIVLAKRTPEDNWQLLRIPTEGGAPQEMGVKIEAPLDGSIHISPDGSRIAFATSKGAEELWTLDNVLAEIKYK